MNNKLLAALQTTPPIEWDALVTNRTDDKELYDAVSEARYAFEKAARIAAYLDARFENRGEHNAQHAHWRAVDLQNRVAGIAVTALDWPRSDITF